MENFESIDLPVKSTVPELRGVFRSGNTALLCAPPGAGKSTLVPLMLLNEPWLEGRKIIMLEPRRLAAAAVARRMAELSGDEPGETVGYRIRFENRTGSKTRIEVVTEAILTRMLQSDNALEQVGLVIFDEFHERSIHADLALALCRECQQVLRPDLRMLVMSATLDTDQLVGVLKCPVIKSEGRQFPVEIIYSGDADMMMLPELAARVAVTAAKEKKGDILLFLPGEAEIKKCAALIEGALPELSVHPLYGQLPWNEQQRAILPRRDGRRKIVLATAIAETSLTIEGVSIVIDSGFARVSRFDPGSGLSKLETIRVPIDSADQRAGRAGRLGPGTCYRMWTAATHSRLIPHRVPEIMEADLTPLMLELAMWGIASPSGLNWITPPPPGAVAQAAETLEAIGAIEGGKVTAHGKEVHRMSAHPRIAHMLLLADDDRTRQLGCDIAAILEERDPLAREEAGADINLRVEVLRRARNSGKLPNRFARIEKVAATYRRLLKVEADNSIIDNHETGLLLAHAYPERVASARPGNNAQFQLANGRIAMIGHQDGLAHEPWLAVAHMDLRQGMGKIFLAAPLNPKDLLPMVKEQEVVTWDTRRGGLIAARELRLGNIVLQSRPLEKPANALIEDALVRAVMEEGDALLDLSENFLQLQNRILSLRVWDQSGDWPDVSTDKLMADSEWIRPYLNGVKRPDDFRKIDAAEALLRSLPWDQQQLIEKLAPARLEVPSGSGIRLQYFPNGATPVLAVRLQEVFGLADTPTVNNGKVKVVMHLLSPGYKPVQVTSDLRSFWNNLYHEVKRELQRRYPKHAWPDDPWSAKAVAKGRSHK